MIKAIAHMGYINEKRQGKLPFFRDFSQKCFGSPLGESA